MGQVHKIGNNPHLLGSYEVLVIKDYGTLSLQCLFISFPCRLFLSSSLFFIFFLSMCYLSGITVSQFILEKRFPAHSISTGKTGEGAHKSHGGKKIDLEDLHKWKHVKGRMLKPWHSF